MSKTKPFIWVSNVGYNRSDGNVLIHTFYLRYYGIRHMVKDYSDRDRGNPLSLLNGPLFPISSKGSLICTIPDRIENKTAFVTSVVENWLEREITQ